MAHSVPNHDRSEKDGRSRRKLRTRRVLNVRLLVGTLIAAAVLGPAAYFWHKQQVKGSAGAMLDRADELREEGKPYQAAGYLYRYLQFHPDDVDAQILLAEDLDASAKDLAAIDRYYKVLGEASAERRPGLRRRLTELLIERAGLEFNEYRRRSVDPSQDEKQFQDSARRRYAAARSEADKLGKEAQNLERAAKKSPKRLEKAGELGAAAQRLLALALYGQYRCGASTLKEVDLALEEAIRLKPDDIPLTYTLATVYRDHEPRASTKEVLEERQQAADELIDNMVSANPTNARAYLTRFRYRRLYKLSEADTDLGNALKHAQDSLTRAEAVAKSDSASEAARKDVEKAQFVLTVSLLEAAGASRMRAGDAGLRQDSASSVKSHLEKARDYYQRASEVARLDNWAFLAYRGLGMTELALRDSEKAVSAFQAGLEKCPAGSESSLVLHRLLVGVLIGGGKIDEAKKTLDVLQRVTKKIGPRLARERRLSLQRSNELTRAKWLLAKGDRGQAIPLLSQVASSDMASAGDAPTRREAGRLLGEEYAAMSQWDQAATAYEGWAKLQPKATRPLLAVASAWMAAGRPDLAIENCKKAVSLHDAGEGLRDEAETWFSLAKARYQQQVGLPKKERDWGTFTAALTGAKARSIARPIADAWRLKLLEARSAIAQADEKGQRDDGLREARELLRQAETEFPDAPGLFGRLVLFYESIDAPEDADRTLAKLADDVASTYLLRSRLCSQRKDFQAARETLQEGLEALPAESHAQLSRALVQISLAEGKAELVQQELTKLHKIAPKDIGTVRQLAELALEQIAKLTLELNNQDKALDKARLEKALVAALGEAERWEDKLRELEGPDGVYWRYYRCRRLLGQAKDTKDSRFIEAGDLLREIRSRRPKWPAAHVLHAQMLQSRGKLPEAIESFQVAIRLGERQTRVYRQLIFLLYRMQRFAEADEYLAQLRDRGPATGNLSSLETLVAAGQGDLERAVESARQGVLDNPEDLMTHIWLGQMLLTTEETEEAEAAFQEALRLAPDDVRPYKALFAFYLGAQQPDRARETLQDLAQWAKLPDEWQRPFLLAQGYQRLGDQETAEDKYREAARLAPDNAGVHLLLARFLLRNGTVAEAEENYRRVLKLAPESDIARRELAAVLAASGDEGAWKEAAGLLDVSGSDEKASQADRRLHAILLAQRGGEANRAKARRVFEQVVEDSPDSAGLDRLMLARLYEAEANHQAARMQYVSLVYRTDPNPFHLASYIEYLLRRRGTLAREEEILDASLKRIEQQEPKAVAGSNGDASQEVKEWNEALAKANADFDKKEDERKTVEKEAERQLDKLQELAPDRLGTVVLWARWQHAVDNDSAIEPRVEAFAEKLVKELQEKEDHEQQEAQLCLGVGNLYMVTGQLEAAERRFRRLAELLPEKGYASLAIAIARQGRIAEAARICTEAAQSDESAQPAFILASVLTFGRPGEEELRLAEPVLAEALKRHPDDANLLLGVANVRVLQQQTDDAIELYRRVLKLSEKNVLALNNLATMLSEQPGKTAEALKYVDQALEIAKRSPALLDTKGMIFVHGGEPKKAIEYLEEAASAATPDPRYNFHLAVAYHRCGQAGKARDELKKAQEGNLVGQILTQKDQSLLTELDEALHQ